MIKILLALVLMTLSNTASSWAGDSELFDGNKLFEHCDTDGANWSNGVCYGYVVGTYDRGRYDSVGVCIPDGVSVKQLIDLTTNYLRDNPQLRHKPADLLIGSSWYEAWPCPE